MGKIILKPSWKSFPTLNTNEWWDSVYTGNKLPWAPSGTSSSTLLSCECHVKWAFLKYMMNTNPYFICLHVLIYFLLSCLIIYFFLRASWVYFCVYMFNKLKAKFYKVLCTDKRLIMRSLQEIWVVPPPSGIAGDSTSAFNHTHSPIPAIYPQCFPCNEIDDYKQIHFHKQMERSSLTCCICSL